MESIPEGLEFNSSAVHPSIFQAWLGLLEEAHSSIDIASFYWTLTNSDTGTQEPTAEQVSWRGWWLRMRNASEDGFSLRRVVCFVLRVRPFWRGWLSSQGNWRFGLQSTHLRSLKTTTSGSSTTQVTLAGDKMTPHCFFSPLKVFRLHDRCNCAAVNLLPLHLISQVGICCWIYLMHLISDVLYSFAAPVYWNQCRFLKNTWKIFPGADIRTVNMRGLTTGVLHTKFWIVDKKHIYIGSANMDWRSLTQVHTHTHDCSMFYCLDTL